MFWGLRVLILLTAALFLSWSASAAPSLTGTLRDAPGNPLAGASITFRAISSNQEITSATNAAGQFTFPDLAPGTYTLTIKAAARTFQLAKPFTFAAAGTTLNLQLPPGGDQIIVIEASASPKAQSSGGE